MKRIDNLYNTICSISNLNVADTLAQKRKAKRYAIRQHNSNREENIKKLHEALMNKAYRTSEYSVFKIYEPKEREIFSLPYYPDRIVHHAIMNVLEPVFMKMFTADTYSCIKGKGTHAAVKKVKRALRNVPGTKYCLKLDIAKYYPNIDHEVLKALLRRKIKDNDLLVLIDHIIDSAKGLPIGNFLSQYLANFYLSYFDHWLKETKRVKYYFRYCDDIVILADNKQELHQVLADIRQYLGENLKLSIKGNYQVFPVAARGIDFLGYRFFHTHTLVRKRIKQNCARKLSTANETTKAAYRGWFKHANCINLTRKLGLDKAA